MVSSSFWVFTAVRKPPARATVERTIRLRIVDRQVVAHDQDVVALTFVEADGRELPRWHPGSHLDIHLPSGLVRQYSLCGNPAVQDRYRIAVRRIPDGGGGSIEAHKLTVGDVITTNGPRNAFPLSIPGYGSPTGRLRFIAGGIGITPILPMLAKAERLGVDWSMIYTGRSRESLPFLDELARFGDRVQLRTDDVDGLPTADDLLGDCPPGTAVYTCGPAPMLTAVRTRLVGEDDIELHFERFAAPPVLDGREFSVQVASTGQVVEVAADQTMLSALTKAGVHAPYSCQQGFCGTCRVKVLGGAVEHRDALLTETEHEAGLMLTCVSRAQGNEQLTLDL
ncbi:PDR/VanB family oxidoreductase [Mycobacterium sp. OTB74]|uniref:PDR/VanB family oxidoreductase n=1 Tax=Mycobacterium sp. OTB74 TaxID=1853452 RepID=UPI002475FC92|nr:PDR/VanB family oxidoreductase [Mycobacterium sp. OTB74]